MNNKKIVTKMAIIKGCSDCCFAVDDVIKEQIICYLTKKQISKFSNCFPDDCKLQTVEFDVNE